MHDRSRDSESLRGPKTERREQGGRRRAGARQWRAECMPRQMGRAIEGRRRKKQSRIIE
jgi:hypothetical protein